MKSSQLVAIIKRLEAMVEAQDNEVQVRRFEKEGVEKCTVTYDNTTETFELTEAESSQPYQSSSTASAATLTTSVIGVV